MPDRVRLGEIGHRRQISAGSLAGALAQHAEEPPRGRHGGGSGHDGAAVDSEYRSRGERLAEAIKVGLRDVVHFTDPSGRDGGGGVTVQLTTTTFDTGRLSE